MTYQPYVGKFDDGTEVLVSLFWDARGDVTVTAALRPIGATTWGPPASCEERP